MVPNLGYVEGLLEIHNNNTSKGRNHKNGNKVTKMSQMTVQFVSIY